MRVRTLEIRWHNAESAPQPIYSCDFQPLHQSALKKLLAARSASADDKAAAQSSVGAAYRLVTGGGDNNVRVWLVHPNYLPKALVGGQDATPHPPRVEYLATLSRHTSAVNVVRFSPNGELIASAGDDGCILIWTPSDRAVHQFGSDVSEEQQYEKEHWRMRMSIHCSQREVYDLAWSPNGEFILAGSTDNVARVFNVSSGSCVREISEHMHYVQGVAWDPLNEFIATQSSDRSVHVHSISVRRDAEILTFESHAVSRNSRMPVRHHHRAPSNASQRSQSPRPSLGRRDSESALSSSAMEITTPKSNASVPSTPSLMYPPLDRPSSRRSSFTTGSNASPPPTNLSRRVGRSPSPMPPLPAIRAPVSTATWASLKLYGDEAYTNFFRRLTFSPDGALLLTPAGQFEDTSFALASQPPGPAKSKPPAAGAAAVASSGEEAKAQSSVYIYSRASFARPPVAHLPGHKSASVVVKFSPVLYELRLGVRVRSREPQTVTLRKGDEQVLDLDLEAGGGTSAELAADDVASGEHADEPQTASVFKLPYRMMFAVATQDTVVLYDTQQAGPIAMFANLHYASFTDVAWAPDGQSLILSSSDGYCSIVIFDEPVRLYPRQQHHLQMAAIAEHHSAPASASASSEKEVGIALPWSDSTATLKGAVDSGPESGASDVLGKRETGEGTGEGEGAPAKKKRRVELKHLGGLDAA